MLIPAFITAIYEIANTEEKEMITKIFEDALLGNLCTEITAPVSHLPSTIAVENPLEPCPKTPFCRLGNIYYLQKNWVFETEVIKGIRKLLSSPVEEIHPSLQDVNQEQELAIRTALKHRLAIITGGPGTGKTYTAIKLVHAYLKTCPTAKVILTAPTGKAIAKFGIAFAHDTQVQVKTLHSLLRIHHQPNFLEENCFIDADLILVDECSMCDAALFSYFLKTIPHKTRVILMGDGEQLPPVEAGSLFADLVSSGKVPCVRLIECLRSSQERILSLAKAVNAQDCDTVLKSLAPIDIWHEVEHHFPGPVQKLPSDEELLAAMEKFKILSCIRKGPFGVDTLNQAILQYFQKETSPDMSLAVPILITKNDPTLNLFNGDTGILVYPSSQESYAYFPNRKMPINSLPPYELAYVLSVHKSQGSEYDKVLLLVPSGSEFFGKEVLYTAITRAKKELLFDGDPEILCSAILHSSKRRSNLPSRL